MGRKCFVPNCRTGYNSCTEKLSTFQAPKDEKRLQKWRDAIGRTDRLLTSKDCVCERHFAPFDIITRKTKTVNGVLIYDIPMTPRLSKDAIPCIFPDDSIICRRKQRKRNALSAIVDEEEKIVEPVNIAVGEVVEHPGEKPVRKAFEKLIEEAGNLSLPDQSWGCHVTGIYPDIHIIFAQIAVKPDGTALILKALCINANFDWHFLVLNKVLKNCIFPEIPDCVRSLSNMAMLVNLLNDMNICSGVSTEMPFERGFSKDAYFEEGIWRHNECELLVISSLSQCKMCAEIKIYTYSVLYETADDEGVQQTITLSESGNLNEAEVEIT